MTSKKEHTNLQIKILLVIPTYNNRKTLRQVVLKAVDTGLDVLVVNDGSTDGALETLSNADINIVSLSVNSGKGAAILKGAEWAEENGYTHIITLDADGQHNPVEVKKFVLKIQEKPLAIIIGKRDFSVSSIPESSKFGRNFSNFWVRVSAGERVSDSQSGYRSYPLEILHQVKCIFLRYNFEMEILVRSIWAGAAVDSIDISVKYSEEIISGSHFRPFMDNYRISLMYTVLVLRNFIPIPHKLLFLQKRSIKTKTILLNPIQLLKNLAKEKTSTHQIVLACMLGVLLGTLPFIGCHSIVIIFFATRLKLNRLIALNISHLCAPPFVPAVAIEAGYFIRNGKFLTEFTIETLGHQALERFGDFFLGSLIIGPLLACLVGVIVFILVVNFRKYQSISIRKGDIG